jgi:hypothetical protein
LLAFSRPKRLYPYVYARLAAEALNVVEPRRRLVGRRGDGEEDGELPVDEDALDRGDVDAGRDFVIEGAVGGFETANSPAGFVEAAGGDG